MEAELIRTFYFEAAHSLPNTPKGHKCSQMHGHSYRVDIHVLGLVDEKAGWVVDFAEINKIVNPIIDELDHKTLNDIPGLGNSTSELIARYLWLRIVPLLNSLSAITIWESTKSRCVYRGC